MTEPSSSPEGNAPKKNGVKVDKKLLLTNAAAGTIPIFAHFILHGWWSLESVVIGLPIYLILAGGAGFLMGLLFQIIKPLSSIRYGFKAWLPGLAPALCFFLWINGIVLLDRPAVGAIAFNPDGSSIAAMAGSRLYELDLETGDRQVENLMIGLQRWGSLEYDSTGSRIIVNHSTPAVCDTQTGQCTELPLSYAFDYIAAGALPGGNFAVKSERPSGDNNPYKRRVSIVDIESRETMVTLEGLTTTSVDAAAFSPDGSQIVLATRDGQLSLHDTISGDRLWEVSGHEGWVNAISWSPDGGRFASAGRDDLAYIWDAASGRQLVALTGHDRDIASIVFNPDGERLLTTDYYYTIIWDARSGEQLLALKVGKPADWSPAGDRIATGGRDGIITIWDAKTGEKLQTISLPRGG